MQCIKIEPGKKPILSEIDNTLAAMQAYVGGYIETVTCDNGMVVIVNEEGQWLDLPENCYLRLLHRAFRLPIRGNALVVRYAADMFMPVTRADLHPVMEAWKDGEAWKAGEQNG